MLCVVVIGFVQYCITLYIYRLTTFDININILITINRKDISIDMRCPGWKTGKCSKAGGFMYTHQFTCKDCGMEIQASNEDYLRDLKKNHKKKSKGMFGESQCDKQRKGKKV